jgi:purine-nucleoside/S-methyl-5'-thioadenosine phosphorylase / adenosine deaminase
VFFHHDVSGPVELWFTDRSLDLGTHPDPAVERTLADSVGVNAVITMAQVHGSDVAWVDDDSVRPAADGMLTGTSSLGLLVRVADCVPIVLAAPDDHVVGVVHCGRPGLVAGVVPAAVEALRERGAGRLEAWLGPRVCGRCYELPPQMADDVADAVPEARSTTSWGMPAADIGAGVTAQLAAADVEVHDPGTHVCTIEDERFFSYRREGAQAGRFGAVAVLRDAQ